MKVGWTVGELNLEKLFVSLGNTHPESWQLLTYI